MRIRWAFFTNPGPRKENEDRVLLPRGADLEFYLAAIADGIGGAPGGSLAATIAIEQISKISNDPYEIPLAFEFIRNQLRKSSQERPEFSRMGTTLSAVFLRDYELYIGHVGDTRVSQLRKRGIKTLTSDQTEVAELLRKGVLRKNQARKYARRNVLLSALSAEAEYEIERIRTTVEVNDRILLTTDGVHQFISKEKIVEISSNSENVDDFVRNLENATQNASPSDNFSAISIEIK